MSKDDNQVPSALVAVGTKALAVRSETLIKRGLALAKSLLGIASGFPKKPGERTVGEILEIRSGGNTPANRSQLLCALGATDGHVRILAAECLARWGEYPQQAIPVLIAVLETIRDPSARNSPHCEEWLRVAAGAIGHYGDLAAPAVPALVLALSDSDCNVRSYAAQSLGNIGPEAQTAISSLKEAFERESVDGVRSVIQKALASAHRNLGFTLHTIKGDYERAIAEHRTAISLDPETFLAHLSLGNSLHASGDAEGAIAEFRKAHDLKPHAWATCFILTGALRGQGHHEAANRVIEPYIAKCREALLEKPDNSAKHAALGQALHFNGDLEGAISEFRQALRLFPRSFSLHQRLRDLLVEKGELPEAIAESREIVRIRRDAWAYCELGKVLLQNGDVDAAIPEFGTAIRLEPNNATAYYNLGLALYDKGDMDGAIAEYREALRLNPNNDVAHVSLGLALRHKGDLDGAIAEYREALRLNPNNDGVHFLIGIVLELKGDRGGALEEYRAAYTLDPKNATHKQNYERLLHQLKK